jgi:cytochrome d ubiquinol oxidase subunit I
MRSATFLVDDPGVIKNNSQEGCVVGVIATVGGLVVFAAVDPVPWARAQMAFTLMFHIILVPLGVSWAFMTLIANYRAVKHGDGDALMLAQRWSKYMAVTFAVGAVRVRC